LSPDNSTIGGWVLRYAPELHKRVRREFQAPNRFWWVDVIMVRMAGQLRPRVINVDGHVAYPPASAS
jgi:transposase-like protein